MSSFLGNAYHIMCMNSTIHIIMRIVQIAFFQKRVTELENKAAEAAIVPSLKQELKNAAIEISRLQKCERILQVSILYARLTAANRFRG